MRLINRTVAQLKSRLQIVFPEFESVFRDFGKKTPLAVLEAFPTSSALLEASPGRLLRLLKKTRRGQVRDGHQGGAGGRCVGLGVAAGG